jgi:uracil-DNA glycosylase
MIKLHESWRTPLQQTFESSDMQSLKAFLLAERNFGKIIYPPAKEWFAALDSTPLETTRVVILGQDPYHGEGQAHGLSFSVRHGVRVPPSLLNIYKELKMDLGVEPPAHGNLQSWAEQGVLLLNAVLTVESSRAASHQGRGWERFTDAVIQLLNSQQRPIVFILWGAYAQKKAGFVDRSRHLVLSSAHPSPLSAHHGFFGSKPFSKANAFLKAHGQPEINWALPSN